MTERMYQDKARVMDLETSPAPVYRGDWRFLALL